MVIAAAHASPRAPRLRRAQHRSLRHPGHAQASAESPHARRRRPLPRLGALGPPRVARTRSCTSSPGSPSCCLLAAPLFEHAPRADRRESEPDQLDAAPQLRPPRRGLRARLQRAVDARGRPAGDVGRRRRARRDLRAPWPPTPTSREVDARGHRADRRRRGHPGRHRRPGRRTKPRRSSSTGSATTLSRRRSPAPARRSTSAGRPRCSST